MTLTTQDHLRASGIRHVFAQEGEPLTALDGINLALRKGEFLSIIGSSGCGKTTLLRILGGLLEPTEGSISIEGEPPGSAQQRKAIGYVFQEAALVPWRTVEENIRLPLEIGGSPSFRKNGHPSQEAQRLLDLTGLREFQHYYPHQLSGGMQQRVALARTLAFNPSILLMDEPFGSLDEITREAMGYELLRLWDLTRKTVVFVTHSISEAVLLSDRVLVISGATHRIEREVRIQLPRPRPAGVEESETFRHYTRELKRLLGGE